MRRRTVCALVVLLSTAALGACSGDDDSESNADATGDDDATTDTTDELVASLASILSRKETAPAKVTYERGGETFTIIQDGDKRAIVTDSSMSIVEPGLSVDCSKLDTQPVCLEVPAGVSSVVSRGLVYYDAIVRGVEAASDADPLLETTTAEIAGRRAICATAPVAEFLAQLNETLSSIPTSEARACFDVESGHLLEFSTPNDPANDLTAITVETPTADDFEPPAPVQGFGAEREAQTD